MDPRIAIAALAAMSFVCGAAYGATAVPPGYPNKSLRLVVPFTPGGAADVLARLTAAKLAETLGQQVVIDNRPGAGGNIAAEVVARSTPDGYTMLQANLAHAIGSSLYRKLGYDLLRDFVAVTQLASTPFILCLNPGVPANSVKELIALAKSQPGRLAYGSSGSGGPSHMATELFQSLAGIQMRHIPYKGGVPASIDLIAGQIQVMLNTPTVILGHVRAGRVKALAVSSAKRIPTAPDLPTISEAALPGYEVTTWFGVMLPAGTSPAIVSKLQTGFMGALKAPDVRERLATENLDLVGSSPAEFAAQVKAEIPKWARVVKSSGARVD
jgi:tripartite-type tricarboxylate transporter receptor subunit TctC